MSWESNEYLGLNPSNIEWARLAAFIDGEGYIGFDPKIPKDPTFSPVLSARIVVTNTDIRLPLWCARTFGMHCKVKALVPGKRKGREANWKTCYFASAGSYRSAWIALNCLPWLLLKRDQAQLIIDHQRTTQVGVFDRGVARKTPQNILEYRLNLKQKMHELNRRGPEEKVS